MCRGYGVMQTLFEKGFTLPKTLITERSEKWIDQKQ